MKTELNIIKKIKIKLWRIRNWVHTWGMAYITKIRLCSAWFLYWRV